MPAPHPQQPSFSPRHRWKIAFDVVVRTALVFAVVVMVNYLGAQFIHRFYLSSQTRVKLAPRTVSVLHSLTNRVAVTLYYDRQDDFYPDIVALLNEYRSVNPKISVRTVDYLRDAGEAEKVKEQYKLVAATDKNLVIFDAGENRVKIANGDALTQFKLEEVPPKDSSQRQLEFERKPVAFRGEEMFTAILLALENSRPFKAYFLQGHGEPSLSDTTEVGFFRFGSILAQNYITVTNLELLGDAPVPTDCNLLIIAGPRTEFSETELQKIDQYLVQGGRLFALFNYYSIKRPTGLEPILQSWGVNVGSDWVQDLQHTASTDGRDVLVSSFSQHPVVNPLIGSRLYLVLPRPISRVDLKNPPAGAPQVDELAFSSPASTLSGEPGNPPQAHPLMAAVEQKPVAGVANARGTTRMLVVGDSFAFGNRSIQSVDNSDFIGYAVNWLLDRPALLQGIGPQPVTEFRLLMTETQRREVRWLLLGALPGAVLLFGGLVWLVRRK
ncbi:MAG: Gldg family protein [Verrucomicrobiota bacterium]